MNDIDKLKARLTELHELAKAVQAKADADRRDLRAEEQTELDALMAEFDQVENDLKRRQRIVAQEERLSTPQPRVATPNPVASAVPAAVAASVSNDGLRNTRLTSVEERQRWGFQSMGEFCRAVRAATTSPSTMDQRLIQNAALSTYGSEGSSADGGFAVPPEWRSEIMGMVDGEDSILARTDQQRVSGNSITFPVDETTAWQTTGGILAYWDADAAMTQSKPALQDLSLKLHRLTALVPVTDELLEDAPAMSSYVTRKAGEKLSFKVTDAIINGTGVGQPLGIMNAPCRVSVAKITSQVAATFHAKNAAAMMAVVEAASGLLLAGRAGRHAQVLRPL